MSRFRVVLAEHGYRDVQVERDIVEAAGGELDDCHGQPLDLVLERCRDAEAILVRRLLFTPERIARLRRCKTIVRYGVGVDNVDLAAATDASIIVGHVPVYCQDEVSTHAISLLLACIRTITSTDRKLRNGQWDVHLEEPVYRLAGKTIGIVGLGTLGQAVARKLQNWNLRLIATDPYVDPAIAQQLSVQLLPLETLLRESDYISLHVPLLPETTHLINPSTLALMKRGSILINTSRGPVVDGTALLAALDSGHLASAALDVFEQEPPLPSSPLRNHPRLIITDHMAWYSEDSQLDLQRKAALQATAVCLGRLPEAIANPEVLDRLGRAAEWTPNHLARWQRLRAAKLHNPS
jgi:D-3-phosphoglycerate dehydrogenase